MKQHEAIPRDHDAPRWLLISLVVILVLGSAAALHFLARSERVDNVFGKPPTMGHERLISGLEQILDEPAKRNLVGQDVQISSVVVQKSVGEYTFWIGSDEEGGIAVISVKEMGRPASESRNIRDGSVVTIFGSVRAAGAGKIFDEDPRLTKQQRAELDSVKIYIAAEQVLVESEPADAVADGSAAVPNDQALTQIARTLGERVSVDLGGRQVTIRDAKVQSAAGDYTFWIGRDEDNRIPAILVGEMTGRQPNRATIIRSGDVVTIFGVIRSNERGRIFDRDPLLNDEQRAELADADTYIAANQVLVHER